MPISPAVADVATAPETRRRVDTRALRRALLGAGAGILLALGFPPYNLFFLPPLGAALLILALQGTTVRQGLYTGLLCGAVYFGGTLFWLANVFGAGAVSLCAILSVFPALFGALWGAMSRRLPRMPLWLLAPILWTGIEYYRSERFTLDFGWMGLGYSLVGSPIWAKLASVAGSYGITFITVAVGSLLALGALRRREDGGHGLSLALGAYCVWLAIGVVPLPAPVPERPLRVRMIQGFQEDDLFDRTSEAESRPCDILIWPEYALARDPYRDADTVKRLRAIARKNRCYFLFGAHEQLDPKDEDVYRNTAYLLGPDGERVGTHVKNHTVHFVNDGQRGTRADAIPTALGRIGVGICFDMDYPDVARRLAADGAEVFLIPNMDPEEWGPVQQAQHRLMFQMRAAECGRWLARADCAGGTSVAAPNGRETARIATGTESGVLEAAVGRTAERTLFLRGGWRFGSLCLLAAIGLTLIALRAAWRERRRVIQS